MSGDRFDRYRDDPVAFAREVLRFEPWSAQRRIVEAVRDHERVAVRACNASGKTAAASTLIPWWLSGGPGSVAVTTATTERQVRKILWREVHQRFARERTLEEFVPAEVRADDVASSEPPTVVPVEEFVATEEPGADPLVGEPGEVLIPENADVVVYGDGGAGKTTLMLDLGCHLAAGDNWLDFTVARMQRVLVLENEGPRPLFRDKLRRKLAAWKGSPLAGRLRVWEEPWCEFTFQSEDNRTALAAQVHEHEIDVVIVGPLTASGMDEAGTLQEVRAFLALLGDVRRRAGRPVTFVIVHHEAKGGKVSGAWEGACETLLHVHGEGHGKTRLFVQKAKWAPVYHGTTLRLLWAEGEGFTVEETSEVTEDTIAEGLLAAVRLLPGGSWTKIRDLRGPDGEKVVRGNATLAAAVRDRLLTEGRLMNGAPRDDQFKLWGADDPAGPRSDARTGQERVTFPPAADGVDPDPFPVPVPKGNGGTGTGPAEPQTPTAPVVPDGDSEDDER